MQPIIRTKGSEEHGLLKTLPNSVKKDKSGVSGKTKEDRIKQKADNARIVKVRYIHRKDQLGGKLQIPYCLGAGEPIQMWTFLSGEEYEVPFGLVKQVNESDGRVIRKGNDTKGDPKQIVGKERTHEFIPVGF